MKTRENQQHLTKFGKGVWWKMVVSIFILGVVGFLFSRYPAQHGGGWYHQLRQPAFAPPYWLPFVMWTLVYILMGCSIGMVWHYALKSSNSRAIKISRQGIILFIIHLVFNLSFPIILIGFHLPVISLIDIIVLVLFILILIRIFYRINRVASFLLIPYLLWIIYAAMLNVAILVLN